MAQGGFRSVLSFDMRAPDFGSPISELYDATLDMCAFGDEIGIDGVIFPEHHASEDGYNPVPALIAAAAAARTKRMEMILGAIVLPLHDPVEVAETIAVTDIICGGRLTTTLAAGYVKAEFNMFGKSLSDRARADGRGARCHHPRVGGRALLYRRSRDFRAATAAKPAAQAPGRRRRRPRPRAAPRNSVSVCGRFSTRRCRTARSSSRSTRKSAASSGREPGPIMWSRPQFT